MKVSTRNFPVQGREIRFLGHPGDPSQSHVHGPVSGRIRVDRSGEYFWVRGEVRTTLHLQCGRCLEDYQSALDLDVQATLVAADTLNVVVKDNLELTSEDLDITTFEGEEFDLIPIIEDHILLAVPLKTLCRETCAGICPHCGANRNIASCRCGEERLDSPFAVLKTFTPVSSN